MRNLGGKLVVLLCATSLCVVACTSSKDMKRGTGVGDGSVSDGGGINIDASPRDMGVDLGARDFGMDSQPTDLGVDLGVDFGVRDAGMDAASVDMGVTLACTGTRWTVGSPIATATMASAAARDFNNDGYDDVLVIDADGGIVVNVGGAAGIATAPIASSGAAGYTAQINSLAVGDMNLDGVPDVVYGSSDTSNVMIAIQRTQTVAGHLVGTGAFLAPHNVFAVPMGSAVVMAGGSIAIADFNNDNFPDIAVADDKRVRYSLTGADPVDSGGYLAILINSGDRTGYHFLRTVAGERTAPGATFTRPDPLFIRVGTSSGAGCSTDYTGTYGQLADLVADDFNHDGNIDLAWIEIPPGANPYSATEMGLSLGDGAGGFSAISADCGTYGVLSVPTRMVSTDWDNDGDTDVVISLVSETAPTALGPTNQSTRFQAFLDVPMPDAGIGSTFRWDYNPGYNLVPFLTTFPGYDIGWSLGAGDFNNDHQADVIMTRPDFSDAGVDAGARSLVDIYFQDSSDAGIYQRTVSGISGAAQATLTGDFNGDGCTEFVVFNGPWGQARSFQLVTNH